MSLYANYGKRIRSVLGSTPTWPPGPQVPLGSIMTKGSGQFELVDHLSSFAATFQALRAQDQSLNLVSAGTKQRIFQAGAEVNDAAKLNLEADASLKLEFKNEYDYALKTTVLNVERILNLLQVARAVYRHADWKHGDYFIVHKVYEVGEFSFLGSEKSNQSIEFKGNGKGVINFLTLGLTAGLTKVGSASVESLGKGGTIATGLVRIKRNGEPDYA